MAQLSLIGLDIGSAAIRAAEPRHDRAGTAITNFGQVPLPPGAVAGGVVNDPATVTTALRDLWNRARFRGRKVVLGVTNRQVVVRQMTIQKVPQKDLRASLPFQVRHVLPLPVESALLDFHPLDQPGDAKTIRGLLIAAPKEPVLEAVRATERAGLHVARVDLASFALLRSAARLDARVEAIVDLGALATTIVIHNDGEPLIVRTVPRGGNEITEAVARQLGLSAEAAELVKCQGGLLDGEDPAAPAAVRAATMPIINEIRSSFAYLTAGDQPARVSRLVLSGGGSGLPGLVDALAADLGVAVTLANPLVRLRELGKRARTDLAEGSPAASISIGLTLGAAAS